MRVILESPYMPDKSLSEKERNSILERNILYARKCVKHSLGLGEFPIASHLLYTQDGILNDDDPKEREQGIAAGLAWKKVAEKQVVYIDYGITAGMKLGIEFVSGYNIPVEYRKILKLKND